MALNEQKWRFFRTFFNIVCTFLEYEGVENQIFSRNITNFLSILAPEIEFSSSWNYKPPKNMRQRLLKSQCLTRNKLKTMKIAPKLLKLREFIFLCSGGTATEK